MGIVYAIVSGKGGVGKTTTTANIGIGIAKEGKKVVLVDFDLGQRNLDLILGLENRVIFDMVHVMDEEAGLKQALIKSKYSDKLFLLAASQTKDTSALVQEKVKKLIETLKEEFDYVILDAPAGIESGFEHTIMFADAVIVVVNPEVSSIRDADKAIGIVDAKCERAKENKTVQKFLIINRINPAMVTRGEMLESGDILDILDIDLLGKIPEDRLIVESSNTGKPVILNDKSTAGAAYERISKRLCGENIAFEDVETFSSPSLMLKIKGLFQ